MQHTWLFGALAGLAGALHAWPPGGGLWAVLAAWVAGTGVAAWVAVRRVHRMWYGPLAAVAALVGVGLLLQARLEPAAARRQAGVWLLSVALAAVIWQTRGGPWARGRGWGWLLAGFAVGVLLTYRWGVHPAGLGGRLWLPLAPGVLIPPGEGLKAAWVGWVARRSAPGRGLDPRGWAVALLVAGLLVGQGDWGSAGLVVLVTLSVHTAQANRLRAWALVAVAVVVLTPGLVAHVPRVAQRWNAWLWPARDPLGYGYQPLAAQTALQRGGWWGVGLGQGQPQQVPLALTDFIFVAWGEEGGWLGLVALVALEAAVWLGLARRACGLPAGWPRALGFGVSAYGAHLAAWVMAGNVRLVPLSGLPLPWVAHGGATLVALSALVAWLTTWPPRSPSPEPCPRAWRAQQWAWGGLGVAVLLRAARWMLWP